LLLDSAWKQTLSDRDSLSDLIANLYNRDSESSAEKTLSPQQFDIVGRRNFLMSPVNLLVCHSEQSEEPLQSLHDR
jgi:hypothetical protein